jgi:hypothetical protein
MKEVAPIKSSTTGISLEPFRKPTLRERFNFLEVLILPWGLLSLALLVMLVLAKVGYAVFLVVLRGIARHGSCRLS